ncbi:hypothetical protein C8J57DRAFT_1358284 [Mycena rebaudengoi]|nr:hypothetical protein C8J57DRAFT_1358284 [Mycena rebaudengoi]
MCYLVAYIRGAEAEAVREVDAFFGLGGGLSFWRRLGNTCQCLLCMILCCVAAVSRDFWLCFFVFFWGGILVLPDGGTRILIFTRLGLGHV